MVAGIDYVYLCSPYSPSLPDNIIELGDPNIAPRILIVDKTEPTKPSQPPYATLSPDRIAEIFHQIFGTKRQTRSADTIMSSTSPISETERETWETQVSQMLEDNAHRRTEGVAPHNSASSLLTHFSYSLLAVAVLVSSLVARTL